MSDSDMDIDDNYEDEQGVEEEEEEDQQGIEEEDGEDGDDDDGDEEDHSSREPKRRKKSKVTASTSKTARKRYVKKSIGMDAFSKVMGGLLYKSMERMDLNGERPEYDDGSSPSMEERFPGMDKESIVTSISQDVFFPAEACECTLPPCYDPTTRTSKEKFNYKSDFLLHIMLEHIEEQEDGQFKCPFGCKSALSDRLHLINHLCSKMHLDFSRWGCHFCPVKYVTLYSLQDHMKMHEEEKRRYQEREKDEDGELINKYKTVSVPKYTQEQLNITFNNSKNPLIIAEKSYLTQILNKEKRFIEFRNIGEQYRRQCALKGCDGRSGVDLCDLCQAIIGDMPPPYNFVKPQQLLYVTTDPPKYYVTEIQNSVGQWISICGNEQCHMMFLKSMYQTFCSEICSKYYETNQDDAFTSLPPPPRQVITNFWPINPSYNQVTNDSFTTTYNQNPPVLQNSPLPNRHVLHVFTATGWSPTCVVDRCTAVQQSRGIGICGRCKTALTTNPSPLLKRKEDDVHNFGVNINEFNGELVFTLDDVIWTMDIYDGTKWSRKCGKWDCPNICSSRESLLCRIHKNETADTLPPFITRQTIQREARAAASSRDPSPPPTPPPPQQQQQQPILPPPQTSGRAARAARRAQN